MFGSATPAAAPATGGFGFGSTAAAAAPTFGAAPAPAPATGGLFGAPAPAPSGGLFGAPAPAPATGGLFGAPAPAPSGGLFGGPAAAPGMGGAVGSGRGSLAAPYQVTRKIDGATSINFQSISAMQQYENQSFEELRLEDYMAGNKGRMGQAMPATTGFGAPAPATGGLFGASAAAPSTGGFGFGSAAATPAPATGGLFGSATPAPATGFGAPAAAPTFGAPAPATGGLFGAPAPAPATGGLFGAPAAAPATGGLFGSTPAPAPATGGLFGAPAAAPATGGLFGAPAAAPATGGLFGAAPAPAPATGGLFGAPAAAPATGGLFGAPAPAPTTGGLFGSPAAAPATGGLFGAPAAAPATGGLFGAPAPAPATGGLFGAPAAAPATGGLFGAPAPAPATGGLFGAPAPAPATGGLFGAPAAAPATGGLFGAPATAVAAPQTHAPMMMGAAAAAAPGATTILVPPAQETLLAQQMAAIENQNKELAVLEAWRGGRLSASKRNGNHGSNSNGGASIIPTSIYQRDAQAVRYRGLGGGGSGGTSMNMNGNGSATMSILESYQAAPRSAAKIRPRGFGPTIAKSALGQRSTKGMLSPTSFLGSATKQLVIKPGALTPKPKTRLLLSDEAVSEKKAAADATAGVNGTENGTPAPNDLIKGRGGLENGSTPAGRHENGLVYETSRMAPDTPSFTSPEAGALHHQKERLTPHSATNGSRTPAPVSSAKGSSRSPVDESYDFYKSVIGSPSGGVADGAEDRFASPAPETGRVSALVPKLTKAGYDVTPSLESLSQMSEADLAAVPNFVVERIGFGSVAWDGAVDVRGVDLDSVVCIEAKAVEVYHKEEESGSKPSVGMKLNRPAILTLHSVYSKNGPDASKAEKEKFERKIAKKTNEMGASLVLYDSDIGVWKLHVEHFSRYALDDDDDSDDEVEVVEVKPNEVTADFESGARGGRAPYNQASWTTVEAGHTRFHIPDDEDDELPETNTLVVIKKVEGKRIQAAEAAYAALSQMEDAGIEMEMDEPVQEEPRPTFIDEGVESSEYIENDVFFPTSAPSSKISICAQLARKCEVKKATSSATDFGMRMGRSFNVCWLPNGSFLHPASIEKSHSHGNKTLIQSRPLVDENLREEPHLLSVHLNHSLRSNEQEFPIFSLAHRDDSILQDYEKVSNTIAQKKENQNNFLFETSSQAFSLISVLFGTVSGDDVSDGIKRKDQGFKVWLRNICSAEIEQTIASNTAEGNDYGAIFAAISGDDMPKAASLARAKGHNMLSTLITNASHTSFVSLSNQIKQWQESGAINHVPIDLLRIYSILTNDLEIERAMYEEAGSDQSQTLDWKRRMLMLLKSTIGDSQENESICSSLVKKYEHEVACGVAPPATSWFSPPTQDSSANCTFFRLMQVFSGIECDEHKIPLSTVISPRGHSPNPLDLSTSFHLASILSSLGVCADLSESEEMSLLESYSSQLQRAGAWEWAVYVSLCQLTLKPLPYQVEWKKRLGMEIICKNYTSENVMATTKRSFLEDLGVPSAWFEKALSTSAIQNFDVSKYIDKSSATSTSVALRIYEEAILPDVLFNGNKEGCRDIINYLETIGADDSNEPTLRGVVYDYLILLGEASKFSEGDSGNAESTYQSLLDRSRSVNRSLSHLQEIPSSSLKLFNDFNLVPRDVLLTEIIDSLPRLMKQLNDTMAGKIASRVESNVLTLQNSSMSAFSCSNDDFMFSQLDSRAALRGNYRMIDKNVSFNNGLVYRPQRL